MTSLVCTVIGDDRPGLVRDLAAIVADHQGDWQESHMSRLAGKFAGILRVDVAQENAADLQAAIDAMQGLQLIVERSDEASADGVRLTIELVGSDRPGIVRQLSQAVADLDVNIDELETASVPAPMAGGQLFNATLHVRLPSGVTTDQLRTTLESVAHEIVVDITLDAE